MDRSVSKQSMSSGRSTRSMKEVGSMRSARSVTMITVTPPSPDRKAAPLSRDSRRGTSRRLKKPASRAKMAPSSGSSSRLAMLLPSPRVQAMDVPKGSSEWALLGALERVDRPCRSLSLVFLGLLLSVAAGTAGFWYLEDAPILDAALMAMVTLFTVGYGTEAPTETGAKLFAAGYSLASIVILAVLGGYISVVGRVNYTRRSISARAYMKDTFVPPRWRSYAWFSLGTVLLVILGTGFLWEVEGFSLPDALLMACTTITTVGFAPAEVDSVAGRSFLMFYIVVGVVMVSSLLVLIMGHMRGAAERRLVQAMVDVRCYQGEVREVMDAHGLTDDNLADTDHITPAEYAIAMLLRSSRITPEDLLCAKRGYERTFVAKTSPLAKHNEESW